MDTANNNLVLYDSPRKNILKGECFGKVNPNDIKQMTEDLLQRGKKFGGKWAWISIVSKMAPIIDPESQKIFAELHEKAQSAGCVAIAFVVGGTVAIKVQAQRHKKSANTDKLVEEYFRTEEEALKWLEGFGL